MKKTYKVGLLVRALESKGFSRPKRGGDKVLEFWHDGKKIVHTFVSHGRGECDAWQLGKMAGQCKLTKREFQNLVDCTMGEDEYIARLRQLDVV